jgi:amino acid transporter
MSRALVLVAGLYVFLAPVMTHMGVKQVWKIAIEIRTRQKAPQTIELSSVPYVLLFYLFFSLLLFFIPFFVQIFSLIFIFWYFFLNKEHTTINPKKIKLNWIKDVAYRKSGLCSKKHIKTCGPENLIFLIEFHKSNFYEPSFARMKRI